MANQANPAAGKDAEQGVSILLVDDDLELCELLREFFAGDQGPIPLPAISGRPAPAGALISTPRVEKVSNRAPRTPAAAVEAEAASAE